MTRYTPRPGTPHTPPSPAAADLYEQAARASWIAPLIAFGLGMCMSSTPGGGRSVVIVRLVVDIIMVLGGAGLGIYALTGVRKRGPERVLVPAVIGLIINGLIILVTVWFFAGGGMDRVRNAARAADQKAVQQVAEQGFRRAGWMGVARYQGALITATSLTVDGQMSDMMAGGSRYASHVVVIAIENSGGSSSLDVDCSSARMHLANGKEIKALSAADVPSGEASLAECVKRFSGERQVAAGGRLTDGVAYFTGSPDLNKVDAITVEISGAPLEIPGRVYSEQEKAELLKKGGR